MIRTRYRHKLLIAFLGLAIFLSAVIGISMVKQSRDALLQQIRSKVLSIAVLAADQIDGDLHEEIGKPGDETGPAYRKLESVLRQIRDLNRRDDVHVKFIYTMRRISENPDKWIYVVDAEEPGEDKSPIGEVLVWEEQGGPEEEPLKLGEAYADNRFVHDDYGAWLTAYAPVRDSEGQIVAMIGVDLRAEDVRAKRDALLYAGLAAFAISVLLGAVLSWLLAKWATRPLEQIVGALDRIGDGHLGTRISEHHSDEFGSVSKAVNKMAESLQEKDALKGALSRYVSRDMGERLIEEGKLGLLSGDRQNMTILFCDSENVSRLAEKFPPQMTVEILNDYLELMVDTIFRHKGTVDRLKGNGLLAVFGAPLCDESKERNAIEAALEMFRGQSEINRKWGLTDKDRFQIGIGIHTGEAIVGNIGSSNRVEFTVVGASVEIATLIENRRKALGTAALVSETTVDPIRNEFHFKEVGDVDSPDLGGLLRLYTLPQFRMAG